MSKTVKLLYRPANAKVRALDPKILTWDDHKKERHNFEPQRVGGKVIYEVLEEYGRILLANQPDRFHLLEPKKLSVRFKSKDGLSYQTREVNSILNTARFKDLEKEMAAEEEAKKAAAQAPKTPETPEQPENTPVTPATGPAQPPTGNL